MKPTILAFYIAATWLYRCNRVRREVRRTIRQSTKSMYRHRAQLPTRASGDAQSTRSTANLLGRDSTTYAAFVVPGSVCQASFFRCTTPVAINPAGAVTGFYADANQKGHGFLRERDGTFNSFDPAGSLSTNPVAIGESVLGTTATVGAA